jgi:Lon protease-like protein
VAEDDIALFPLEAVLFPGGLLDLRIFERRYLDMVSRCAREDAAFGVCLILKGQETGTPAIPAAVGTLARIRDFHTLPDGLLGIRVEGTERFRVTTTRVRDNGLVHGRVQVWPPEPSLPLPVEHALLAEILERLHDRPGGRHALVDRACYDDAVWVGYRLAEALPLATTERQHLLQLDDPLQRLDGLLHVLPRFQREE